ncbi:MAG: beta-phosphoglucomutase [Bacteroidetes bacterium GWF2_41_31]|nr:MAG: beta-phosphoglucomutase [Bacteroidetes bacterium GWF2_41_31]OFZ02753.1 MAG: beta-phosphoglucomutase [Bacteroidetes bacterium RIFOXYB12_FULL_41_6]
MVKNSFEAVIFDLDGVITKTAITHSQAWKKMFDQYLTGRQQVYGEPFVEFTKEDYLTYVDGKPRYEGVQSFLKSRNIDLPFGTPEDSLALETVCGLGNRKNEAFNEVLANEGVEVYPSTVALLEQLKKDHIRIGVASSSKNCEAVLTAAGLNHFVETRVDGVVSAEMGLKGKPQPDIFLTAAKNLGVDPDKTIVVEDAVSGVQAGKNGNFGLVIGLAREENHEALRSNGADLVVSDLEEITLEDLNEWFNVGKKKDSWTLKYHDYNQANEKSREALLTIGNGYFGTRGAMEETSAGESNYPGTYIASLYNRLSTPIADRMVENEDFVNAPNWLPIRFKIDDETWFDPNQTNINQISRTLNFKNGLLTRSLIVTDEENRKTAIKSERFASMYHPHQACIRYSVTPLNYTAVISFSSSLDGTHKNEGVNRYKALNQQHLQPVKEGGEGNLSWLLVKTTQSGIEIAEAAKLTLTLNGTPETIDFGVTSDAGIVYTYASHQILEGETLGIEKMVSIHASHLGSKNPLEMAISEVKTMLSFDDLLQESAEAWDKIWDKVNIKLTGDRLAQKLLRMHTYHLMVSASPHNRQIDASMTARGLHGEAYRGHIFWDELYILPFYDIHFPETAKSMLMYRYRRLDKAREYAKEYGYKGAMFPWQSGSDGREETQVVHLNPLTGHWGDDYSSLQRHVSLAIAYDIWQYFHITGDWDFMENYGAEMFLDICQFWESKCQWNQDTRRYSIDKVMGPDEFHESYPDTEEGGLRDNAYTNIMVSWMFDKADELIKKLSLTTKNKLFRKTGILQQDIEKWNEIKIHLNLVINKDGIIAQYDGYFELKELDWDYYRNKFGNIYRMDRLLKAEGKSADDYKVAKQADTLMTFYNLDQEQVAHILLEMGYSLPKDFLERNLRYYLDRTSHGSTLSRVVHSQLANAIGNYQLSSDLYRDALTSDYADIQGGTTAEGIHAGVMAGTLMIALNTFAGIDLRGERLKVTPHLPETWKELAFRLTFKGVDYQFEISKDVVQVMTDKPAKILIFDSEFETTKGATLMYIF